MFDGETEEHLRAVKESYPDAVVFHEVRGLFAIKDSLDKRRDAA